MAIINGVTVNFTTSPRIITIPAPTTEVTVEDLQDTLLNLEDEDEGILWEHLRNTSGGEDLGGGVSVGWTMELQNSVVSFEARTTVTSSGTATTADALGATLIDSAATFITDGVTAGATIHNDTDGSVATIISVDSETQLTSYTLSSGTGNDWGVSDAYRIWNEVQCEVSGGNLVAVDDVGVTISPFLPTFGTQILRTSSSSATTANQSQLEHSTFNTGVTVDTTSIYSGTTYPTGTQQQPVNNVSDARTIATERGFIKYFVRNDLDLGTGDDVTGLVLEGESQTKTHIHIDAAATVVNTEFENAHVEGTLDGGSKCTNCHVSNLNYVDGHIELCVLAGTLTLGGAEEAHFLDCWSGIPGVTTPTINMGGSGQALAMRNYNGGIKLTNKTGADNVSIDLNSGQVRLDPNPTTGVTNGTLVIRGTGKVVNDTTGVDLPYGTSTLNGATIINETVNTTTIAEATSNTSDALTLAEYIAFKPSD